MNFIFPFRSILPQVGCTLKIITILFINHFLEFPMLECAMGPTLITLWAPIDRLYAHLLRK